MDRNPFLSEDPKKMLADGVQTSGEAESKYSSLSPQGQEMHIWIKAKISQ